MQHAPDPRARGGGGPEGKKKFVFLKRPLIFGSLKFGWVAALAGMFEPPCPPPPLHG